MKNQEYSYIFALDMMNTAIFHYFHKIIRTDYLKISMGKVQKLSNSRQLKKALLAIVLIGFTGIGEITAQFWTEDFGSDFNLCSNQEQEATAYPSVNGPWTITSTGINGAFASKWYVSATTAGGFLPGTCGGGCIASPGIFNQTLHVGVVFIPPSGYPDPDSGASYSDFPNGANFYSTSKRIESPTIDCSGQYVISLDFLYVAAPNANDKCTVFYSEDGVSWENLGELPNSGACGGAQQYPWEAFQVDLPASANDNPNVKIGFMWQNNSDGVKNNYSVALDNITLTAGPAPQPPVANFEVLNGEDTFCQGGCATMNDLTTFDNFSTGAANATYSWSFPGGNPATSSDQNPTVCYDTFGQKNITLTVEDNLGTGAPVTINNIITVLDCGPVVDFSANNLTPCANEQCVNFSDQSQINPTTGEEITGWMWTFTSPSGVETTSFVQNPTNICLNEIGFYDVTLAATDADVTKEQTFFDYIEVLDCSGPEVDFEADRTVLCPGGCIELTDMSTSPTTITAWHWSLPGGQAVGESLADTSNQQNPTVCYEVPGTYNITLTAVDQEGPSAITKTITVTVDPCTGPPDANFIASADSICPGDCVDFTDQSLGLVQGYQWIFQGTADINDATSVEQNPSVICYNTPGSYDVTLIVSNFAANGQVNQVDTKTITDMIVVKEGCISKPVPRIEVSSDTICAGKCVDFTNASTGKGLTSYQWNFQGAVPGSGSSTAINPQNICYNNPGVFDVSLIVTGAGGDSTRVFQDVVTVVNTADCRPDIDVSAPDTLCAGDCAVFSAVFTDADSVRWTFQGGNPEVSKAKNPGLVCFEEEGSYMILVEAWNPSGGAQPIVLDLFVGERPPLNAGPNKTINAGAVVTLTGSLGNQEPTGNFLWQPFDMVDDFTAQSVKTSPDETTQYIVYYKEEGTCTAIDTVTIMVNFVAAVGVPTAFSPNGDGNNDVLRVLGQGITRMDFKVFNRYGQLVFSTNNQSNGWDGTQNGKELNPGTFVYTLDVTFAEGEREVYTGNVTLVK